MSGSENVFQLDGWIVTKPSPSKFKTAVKMEVKAFKSMIENYIFLSNAAFKLAVFSTDISGIFGMKVFSGSLKA